MQGSTRGYAGCKAFTGRDGKLYVMIGDMHTGPNGNLFIVSLSNGAVHEIFRAPRGQAAR